MPTRSPLADDPGLHPSAAEAIRRRGEFISAASHELKTPLTQLQLQIHSLLRRVRSGGPAEMTTDQLARLFEGADAALERLSDLIDDLLDLACSSAGHLRAAPTPVALDEIVRDMVALCTEELEAARCAVELDLEPDLDGTWDRRQIEQMVTSLLTNAMKRGAGAPIAISAHVDGKRVVLAVKDGGVGVSKADHGGISRRFQRAGPPDDANGLGLRLYLARQIIELHGGSIEVDGAPGSGATFTVTLPRRAPGAR